MTRQQQPRALVVGAGIGGLAAALALERAGMRVTVLERATELRELGFALLLASNAMRALRLLGVADRVLAQTEAGRSGELRAASGQVLRRFSLDAAARETGEDTVCALRQALHGSLVAALQTTEVRTGAHALCFQQDTSSVVLELEGGEQLRAELLIGADGLHSKLRAALHPGSTNRLRPSGLVGYRGVCRAVRWSASGVQYFGQGVEAGVARAGGDAVYWFVSTRHDASRSALSAKDAALEAIRGFDPALVELVERTEPGAVRDDALFDRRPLRSWVRGRVALLGDAAHPMLPHAGQGAAQALEDAVVLGRCVAANADIAAALRRYERLRIARANEVVAIARRNARAASMSNAWLCKLRDFMLEHGPATLLEKQLATLARVDLEV